MTCKRFTMQLLLISVHRKVDKSYVCLDACRYLRLVTRINSRSLKTPVAIILSLPDTPECMLPGTEKFNMAAMNVR